MEWYGIKFFKILITF